MNGRASTLTSCATSSSSSRSSVAKDGRTVSKSRAGSSAPAVATGSRKRPWMTSRREFTRTTLSRSTSARKAVYGTVTGSGASSRRLEITQLPTSRPIATSQSHGLERRPVATRRPRCGGLTPSTRQGAGSPSARLTLGSTISHSSEGFGQVEHSGPEQQDEQRREDQEHEREEDLHRRLLRPLLGQ